MSGDVVLWMLLCPIIYHYTCRGEEETEKQCSTGDPSSTHSSAVSEGIRKGESSTYYAKSKQLVALNK